MRTQTGNNKHGVAESKTLIKDRNLDRKYNLGLVSWIRNHGNPTGRLNLFKVFFLKALKTKTTALKKKAELFTKLILPSNLFSMPNPA